MEFPTLGQHCQEATCKQNDFLPLKCECGKLFCREHFTGHCLSTGCGLPSAPEARRPREPDQVFRCSSPGCGKGSLVQMPCPKCAKHFCIDHRFHPECPEIDEETLAVKREEFAAPRRQFQESNNPIQEQITENIRKALKTTQKSKTAAKIQLMRIKQKASGPKSIPASDRVYFSIVKPKDLTPKIITIVESLESIPAKQLEINFDLKKVHPVFVSRNFSLGRVMDVICDTCSISNDNNMAKSNKVTLFRSDGYRLGDGRMDVEVQQLIGQEMLIDGDSLIVEYIEPENKLADKHVFLKLPVESM